MVLLLKKSNKRQVNFFADLIEKPGLIYLTISANTLFGGIDFSPGSNNGFKFP